MFESSAMFEGSALGNLLAIVYFAVFMAAGIYMAKRLFTKETTEVRIWLGLVAGTVLLMWLPAVTSFIMQFNVSSHMAALALLLGLCVVTHWQTAKKDIPKFNFAWSQDLTILSLLVLPLFIFFVITLNNHTIPVNANGDMTTGQCTYGDMNLHLSFITSTVVQGSFPPHYTILPPTSLSYPFLGDTVSSSLYLFGASLRLAYMLPMFMGAVLIFAGGYIFFAEWLKAKGKTIMAFVLFFLNGGFGFAYFFDLLRETPSNFTRIFNEFYQTPNNLDGKMIRWVNGIVDMLIPQRTTLFGWMVLFAFLFLLYKAVFQKEKKYFLYAGIIAGLTPLINTHIFFSMGIISAVWLLSRMVADNINRDRTKEQKNMLKTALGIIAFGALLTAAVSGYLHNDLNKAFFPVTIFVFAAIIVYGIYQFFIQMKNKQLKELAGTWGLFLLVVALLAGPQLFGITFQTATEKGFSRPHFNWINSRDDYIWFYIKNIGLPAILLLPALLKANKRQLSMVAPAALLLLIADTYSLQPYEYDNNKLLFPAYILVVGIVAIYMVDIYNMLKKIKGTKVLAGIVIFTCVISAVLSMGREYVSGAGKNPGYTIYDQAQIKAAEYIYENAPANATLLTDPRINNTFTSLAGRNTVCGYSFFIYSHGHSKEYDLRQGDIKKMYSAPAANQALFQKYNVDYVLVSAYERNTKDSGYYINDSELASLYLQVYNQDSITIYAVTDRAKKGK